MFEDSTITDDVRLWICVWFFSCNMEILCLGLPSLPPSLPPLPSLPLSLLPSLPSYLPPCTWITRLRPGYLQCNHQKNGCRRGNYNYVLYNYYSCSLSLLYMALVIITHVPYYHTGCIWFLQILYIFFIQIVYMFPIISIRGHFNLYSL